MGCKVNQYEGQAIRQTLVNAGLTDWPGSGPVDLCVVHSCCITAEAARKSRQLLRRRANEHPEAAMLLSGCCALAEDPMDNLPELRLVSGRGDDLAASLRQVADELISDRAAHPADADQSIHRAGTSTISIIKPSTGPEVKEFRAESPRQGPLASREGRDDSMRWTAADPHAPPTTLALDAISGFDGRTRAFVKIQDGCDRFCSYCIIPHLRNKLASRRVEDILSEVTDLLENGYKEIVLCGINLGAYGFDSVRQRPAEASSAPLAALLDHLAGFVGDRARIRISSLDPSDVYPGLAEIINKHDNLCPHLHLSLQSGSDAILARMNRNYDSQRFLQSVRLLGEAMELPSITTDVIVGFPGESEKDFYKTLEISKLSKFSRIHIFPFSPRPGTPADGWSNERPDPATISRRCDQLRSLAEQLAADYTESLQGREARVLIEDIKNGKYWGYCQRYTQVAAAMPKTTSPQAPLIQVGEFVDTRYGH